MFSLRRPSAADLSSLVARQAAAGLSYREVGATRGEMPPGYRHDRWSSDLGSYRPERFDSAAAALRAWVVQTGAGMTVFPSTPVETGATFALVFPVPLMPFCYVTAPGRVVFVTDEPGRSGFGYGTLPGHPEQGEESFFVVRRGDRIWFEITAFSRPRHPLARLARPVTRLIQLRATKAYLAAMREAIGPAQDTG